jgi:hypothetical protein
MGKEEAVGDFLNEVAIRKEELSRGRVSTETMRQHVAVYKVPI